MAAVENPLLETRAATKRFSGLEAVKSVNMSIRAGEVRAIIGPNGAGKTTLVSLISGRLKPTSGTIYFRGREVTRLPAHKRVAMGIVYTFQILSLFPSLTAAENIALAIQRRLGAGFIRRVDADIVSSKVQRILETVGLGDEGEYEAGSLPYGHQRLLDIGMALALEPVLLILDEPTQGLSAEEIDKIGNLVRSIVKDTTILLIEHNIRVVMELADRITVMANGSIIAEGPPSEVESNAEVQRIYLGI